MIIAVSFASFTCRTPITRLPAEPSSAFSLMRPSCASDRHAHLERVDLNVAAAITVAAGHTPVAGAFTQAAHLESP